MKVVLKCNTSIKGEKIPGQNKAGKATCVELEDQAARDAINRQHARLATKDDVVNWPIKKAEK